MKVYLRWNNCTVQVISSETGEVLESGIICLAFAISLVESRGWELCESGA